MVDHKNGDPTDNRRANLRKCSRQQNQSNQKLRRDNSTGYKGVGYVASRGKYHAYIGFKGKLHHLGWFESKTDAGRLLITRQPLFILVILFAKSHHNKFRRNKWQQSA